MDSEIKDRIHAAAEKIADIWRHGKPHVNDVNFIEQIIRGHFLDYDAR